MSGSRSIISMKGWITMDSLQLLRDTISQKENTILSYLKSMRVLEDNDNRELAGLYANLAKAEEKHIIVLQNQLTRSFENDQAE